MIDATITLIAPTDSAQDDTGVWRDGAPVRREIFAKVESVGRSEFFAGGQAGMRPEYKFTVFPAEYAGEETCEYEGQRYAIYRTYQVPGTDELELYAQREVGVHGEANAD